MLAVFGGCDEAESAGFDIEEHCPRACRVGCGAALPPVQCRDHDYAVETATKISPRADDDGVKTCAQLASYSACEEAQAAGFSVENGLAHPLARDAITHPSLASTPSKKEGESPDDPGMLVIRAQHAKTGKVSVLKIKKGTKMASVFEAHAKHKGLKSQSLSVMKQRQQQQQQQTPQP